MRMSPGQPTLPLAATLFSLSLIGAMRADAQTLLTEVTHEVGATPENYRGAAMGDYDNDGWTDQFAGNWHPNESREMRLIHNEGGGRFTDHTAQVPLPLEDFGGGTTFVDFDNDNDLDLFVPYGAFWPDNDMPNVLLRNDRGTFVDITTSAGLADEQPTDNAIWFDYDHDGWLDLYVGSQGGEEAVNILYRNSGDGTFVDVTSAVGIEVGPGGSNGGMAAADFDDDGWVDLYVGVWRAPNRLFLNNGDGTFRDATGGDVGHPGEAFAVSLGDVDNDLRPDLFQGSGGGGVRVERSVFLQNVGAGQFVDVLTGIGLEELEARNTPAGELFDVDNDGDLDLLTGHFGELGDVMLYFRNEGGVFVADQSSLAWGGGDRIDYDRDGFVDRIGGCCGGPHVYRNTGNGNHWLQVELVGLRSNRNGIGSRIVAIAGDLRQRRDRVSGLGYSQSEMIAHFGLGANTRVDTLEVRWPSGEVDLITDVDADRRVRIFEGSQAVHDAVPSTWVDFPGPLTVDSEEVSLAVGPALFSPGARVTSVVADLSNLGGGTEVPLEPSGDGSYVLPSAAISPTAVGPAPAHVMIDQETAAGPYWTRMTKPVDVVAATDLVIYGDELAAGWEISGSAERIDPSSSDEVLAGAAALRLDVVQRDSGIWRLRFQIDEAVSLFGYTHIQFSVLPIDVSEPQNAVLSLGRADLAERIDLQSPAWQVVALPLEELQSGDRLFGFSLTGNIGGTLLIDDVRLLTAASTVRPTAVLETRDETRPTTFTLHPNHPNPFNPETTIPFDLADDDHVELAVYNLTAQRVATLVQGHREAGSYSLRWDGRDDAGRELASGVYLYQLRTTDRVSSRKLLLLR